MLKVLVTEIQVNTQMKISELVNYPKQIEKPQSPGSRGMRQHKRSPNRRYFDLKNQKKTLDK